MQISVLSVSVSVESFTDITLFDHYCFRNYKLFEIKCSFDRNLPLTDTNCRQNRQHNTSNCQRVAIDIDERNTICVLDDFRHTASRNFATGVVIIVGHTCCGGVAGALKAAKSGEKTSPGE